jgi:hypothetical protein
MVGLEIKKKGVWQLARRLSFFNRGSEIRTHDLFHPKEARYQAALYPDVFSHLPEGIQRGAGQSISRKTNIASQNERG